MDNFLIDDPEFTNANFRADPFRWIDPAQYRRLVQGSIDAIVEVNHIEGFPNLFNAIAMSGNDYLLLEITDDGFAMVRGRASCRHLILNDGGSMGMSALEPHQSVLATAMTLANRDVASFSPIIQVHAILGTHEPASLLLAIIDRLADDFRATPDGGRKAYIFYYMLYTARYLKDKKALLARCFGEMDIWFVYKSLTRMRQYSQVHDAVREGGRALRLTARGIYGNSYYKDGRTLVFEATGVALHDGKLMAVCSDQAMRRTCKASKAMIGYKSHKLPWEVAVDKKRPRLGEKMIRRNRKERPNVLMGVMKQSLITEWSHGKYDLPATPPCNNNKSPGGKVEGEVIIIMKNAKSADQFIDYLLAVSGEVGELVAKRSDPLTTMRQRRAFVKAVYKRAGAKLSAKQYGEWAMRFVRSMIRDQFLNDEAMDIVGTWDLSHGQARHVKRTVYANLLNRLANIYVPAG